MPPSQRSDKAFPNGAELWLSTTGAVHVVLPGGEIGPDSHLFVGHWCSGNRIMCPSSEPGKTIAFESCDAVASFKAACGYAAGRNSLPGVVLNATGIAPHTHVVVALSGARYKAPGAAGFTKTVPENCVLAVNMFAPQDRRCVPLKNVGDAAAHVLPSALDAVQKLYNCHDPAGDQYVHAHTIDDLQSTATLAGAVWNVANGIFQSAQV